MVDQIRTELIVEAVARNFDKVAGALKSYGAATDTLAQTQNKLALSSLKAEKAAESLADAQRRLQSATDPADQEQFRAEVLRAQVALDRESMAAVNAANKLDKLEKEALEAARANTVLATSAGAGATPTAASAAATTKATVNLKQFANAGLGMVGVNASMASSLGPVGIALGVVAGGALGAGKAFAEATKLAKEFATPEQLARLEATDRAWIALRGTVADFNTKGGTMTNVVAGLHESVAAHINAISIWLVQQQLVNGQIDDATAKMKIGKIITGEYGDALKGAADKAMIFQDALGKVANNAAAANQSNKGSLIGVPQTQNGGGITHNPLAGAGHTLGAMTQNNVALTVQIQGGTFTASQGDAKRMAEQLGPHIITYLKKAGISLPGMGITRQ